jgi:trans-aconitate methyltransferase
MPVAIHNEDFDKANAIVAAHSGALRDQVAGAIATERKQVEAEIADLVMERDMRLVAAKDALEWITEHHTDMQGCLTKARETLTLLD